MPIAAQCPNCGGPLSETSVLALAPVCERCGTVITKLGGTLGLTSAYGVNDPTITRKRVEADLAVFCDYGNKYVGMLEACKEQLNWGMERYAKHPNPPQLLSLQPVPHFEEGLRKGLGLAFMWGIPCFCISIAPISVPIGLLIMLSHPPQPPQDWRGLLGPMSVSMLLAVVWYGAFVWFHLRPHYKAKAANGDRPFENARRQKAYEETRAAALKAAEPVKAAQDHRLRCQIRELEGLITTVTEKAEDVRRLLRTL